MEGKERTTRERERESTERRGGEVWECVHVLWCAPDGDELLVKHGLESFLDELVRARDEAEPVQVGKLGRHLGSEEPTGAAGRDSPGVDV